MSSNDYHFVDNWRVEGAVKEVADILEDALSLSTWWPSVYFAVKELEKGGKGGVGKIISLRAGGWLPYNPADQLSHYRIVLSERLFDGRYRRFGGQRHLDP